MVPRYFANLLVILLAAQGWCKPSKSIEDDYNGDTPSEDYTDTEYSSTGDDSADAVSAVEEPPQIISKSQSLRVRAGSTVTLPCLVKNTDNLVVMWKKNNEFLYTETQAFAEDQNRIVRAPNNSLVIYNANVNDSSDHYECSILTKPEPISIVHRLLVDPPTHDSNVVRVTPGETVVVKQGDSITLGCHTNMESQPEIKWFRKSKRLPIDKETVNGNYITIHAIDRHHGGIYQCLAEVGEDTPPHAAINVIVEHPPEVEAEHEWVHTGIGADSELICIVHAHPHASVTWFKNLKPILPKKGRYVMKDIKSRRSLRIVHTTEHDLGRYTCVARNSLDESNKTIILTGAPSQASIHGGEMTQDDKGFILKWRLESYSPITEYKLEYRRKGDAEWTVREPPVTNGDGIRFTVEYPIENLEPGSYEAVLKAKNAYGWSPFSVPHVFNKDYDSEKPQSVSGSAVRVRPFEAGMTLLLVLSPYVFASL